MWLHRLISVHMRFLGKNSLNVAGIFMENLGTKDDLRWIDFGTDLL